MEIRNFVIIAHIDHGKSTLADRFLELTGSISERKMRPQYLDSMDLEREKGITIKMQPVRMMYKGYMMNLVDTPGHVDFSYEVSRSLAAVEGAILLVDAGKGIQAQTLANLDLAKKQGLSIIPVVNKIDLPQANVEECARELAELLNVPVESVLKISAKNGTNVIRLLDEVIERVPKPKEENVKKPLRALIFDSVYDSYKGVIAYVRILDGKVNKTDKLILSVADIGFEIKEIGFFNPELVAQDGLSAGEIGYIATGIKEPGKVRVGDTVASAGQKVDPLSGYKEPEPMVFASLYPEDANDFDILKDALSKLKLNDPSLVFEPETKEALGRGFRCGFLGTLHAEIISERLRREFDLNLIISTPSVVYKITDNGKEKFIYTASDWPEQNQIQESKEPWVLMEVITPASYMGKLMEVFSNIRAVYRETRYIAGERLILLYEVPLREVIVNLYEKIKGVSQGFASMSYLFLEYRNADLMKMDIFVAGEPEPALSKIVPRDLAYEEGKTIVSKLKDNLPAQQFSVALQAVIGGKVVARETIKQRRKDVTGYLYGGDYSRKRKLLEKQKKGKKKMKESGRVNIPPKVFLEVFRS
ncbi:MAG: translation elongation factor 4 [bacterium]|nr:translation elongation factor 4 [bacterium]